MVNEQKKTSWNNAFITNYKWDCVCFRKYQINEKNKRIIINKNKTQQQSTIVLCTLHQHHVHDCSFWPLIESYGRMPNAMTVYIYFHILLLIIASKLFNGPGLNERCTTDTTAIRWSSDLETRMRKERGRGRKRERYLRKTLS